MSKIFSGRHSAHPQTSSTGASAGRGRATACVLGDLDLVAPLAMAGVQCAVVAPPGDPARYSRKVHVVGWADPQSDPAGLLQLLLTYARSQTEPPVLYFQSDQHTLFVSRYLHELAVFFRVLIAEKGLLEDLLDKLRFRVLAERLELPVPRSQVLHPLSSSVRDLELTFPLLIKPSSRDDKKWVDLEPARKAIRVESEAGLSRLWPALVDFGSGVLIQELIPGPETRIESYHTYVNAHGDVAAEFTGRKLRTKPVEFGRSTALTITEADDVKELGRRITSQLGLRGVAKLDFKRDSSGTLWLLEVNPRYTLWCHPAARAGVNIPALVWADLTKQEPPPSGRVTPGVSWCSPWDLQAARMAGMSVHQWLAWARRCETRSMMDWHDPLPFLRLCVQRAQRFLRARSLR